MNKLRSIGVDSLAHMREAALVLGGAAELAFERNHEQCGDDFAPNDYATCARSSVLSVSKNLLTPHGPIFTLSEGPRQPVHTTWLSVPTPLGSEAVMVSIGKHLGGEKFRLTKGVANSRSTHFEQPPLQISDRRRVEDILLGIQICRVKIIANENGDNRLRTASDPLCMRLEAHLFGGFLDRKKRIFHISDSIYLFGGEFGGGKSDGPSVVLTPSGPRPLISRS